MVYELFRYVLILLFPEAFLKHSENNGKEGVIVTMTTLPSRIRHIAPAIASWCHQTIPPEKIIVNLPLKSKREQCEYEIPKFLTNNAKVEIHRVAKDYGPATKLLPSLRKYAGEKIQLIVADDDEIYGRKIIENYLNYHRLAESAALTLVGWEVPKNQNHHSRIVKFGAIGHKPKKSLEIQKPTQVDCFQGASTFMVRPTFFSEKIFDYEGVPEEAFYVDDIYLSGHLATQKIPIYVVPANFRYARMKIPGGLRSKHSLHKKENKSGHNNNALYTFYEAHWPSRKAPSNAQP